ncbi:molybdenum cofactor biosynthesis protein MoaB [Bacillus safensis]|uniref:MogA/MoaB family molybdenum cofactor biosynthesis protein n=1 Tax=Bacillus TaxID=1386 RepID=UPI000BA6625A|nr:molybdenum cofactor biosynthesis protein B [Bacillus safensis]OYN65842.1 molybdenum cofactor biosynthesis protein [Bacillus safensis]UQZ93879.1 molybdenum cofactor biosynthesis protein MoaB [Bacillus safensis]WAT79759.1 molybdenum cofactor biosynthesis protein MoaB [Bacillus safensis]WCL58649.1 molybdenum cofactor biosynthesis protein MoaB [Bacillus safensis]
MSVTEHKREAKERLYVKVITVSDTRTKETDKSGRLMIDLLKEQGHLVLAYDIVKDDIGAIQDAVLEGTSEPKIDAVLLNGGTGIAARDVTIEAITPLFSKELPGFGEIFRMLSYTEDIGSAAILSRATAGVVNQKAVFATPGSTGAVRLAMTKLVIPELPHVLRELEKDQT